MNLLDMHTILFSYMISNFICLIFMGVLWKQNHRRFEGMGWWLADYILQVSGFLLIALRGRVPDFLSIMVSNGMIVGGTLLYYMGLQRFTGKPRSQVHNYALLAVYFLGHTYFTYIEPSRSARVVFSSGGLFLLSIQTAWFLLRRVGPPLGSLTRGTGITCALFALASLLEFVSNLVSPLPEDLFSAAQGEMIFILSYQMLFVFLTFALFSMVNRRLADDLFDDIAQRRQAEELSRQSQAQLEQANRGLAELTAIVVSLTSSLALEDVLQSILEALPRFFPELYGTTVQLLDERDGRLYTLRAGVGPSPGPQEMVFLPGQGIAGRVWQERRPYYAADITADPCYLAPSTPPEYRSLLAVPLIFNDQALGVLNITALPPGAFDEKDLARLENLAGYIAIAVQNARLYRQTRQDAEARKILLGEVNHRVKNNLVSILTLVNIEKSLARQKGHKPAHQALADLAERIRSILQVHEQLSASRWEPLPAGDLVRRTVQAALSASPIYNRIELAVSSPQPGKLWVSPYRAGDVALVANELATNAAKYAFAGREAGRIEIELCAAESGARDLRLVYHDDGPGWPPAVLAGEGYNTGLGLIESTAHGKMKLENEAGARLELWFRGALVDEGGAGRQEWET